MPTGIEWTAEAWNPTTGCTKVSQGCARCYAERMSFRLRGRYGYPQDDPFALTLHPDRLDTPFSWKEPVTVFVDSMSDLFHPAVPFDFIGRVWDTMRRCPQHTFQILTKRPPVMLEFVKSWCAANGEPLRNAWLGVSAEDQATHDERVSVLLKVPAEVLFLSAEPLLGAMSVGRAERLHDYGTGRTLDWIIAGGESGPGARPANPAWFYAIRDACRAANKPFLFKQWGAWVGGHAMHRPTVEAPMRYLYDNDGGTGGTTEVDHDWGDGWASLKVGKKNAGRRLWDYGTHMALHDEFPKPGGGSSDAEGHDAGNGSTPSAMAK